MKQNKKFSLKVFLPTFFIFILAVAFFVPIPYYIEGPGTTENLKEIIRVDNKKDHARGSFYLTTVGIRPATMVTALIAKFSDFYELENKKELMGDNSNQEYNQIQQYYMDSSKNAAIEQALKLAHLPYKMTFKGVYVLAIEDKSDFNKKIKVGDTVVGIDGHTFNNKESFMDYVQKQKIGQKAKITYVQNGKEKKTTGKLMQLPTTKKAGIGITLVDHTEIIPSIPVSIKTDNIGGPSAGLMFTLEIYKQLTHKDLQKGYKIAGTGTMDNQGIVGRIGGIDKKIVTASKNNIDIFFAPNDEITKEIRKANPKILSNYKEAKQTAKKIDTKMKIIPVKTVQEAVNYLEKLPEKGSK
ncbi:SepM family pheromone-processing serine protease [Melissococcus plutonius]|uniref:SepM family pheromone-processing serine protease n=1 Tax=Melissococcus plutonius TaxID=33970 RepID=UPI00065F64FF|nr:SepM family pheromone-processing serine protease [Melissococcus plutonius]AIM25832.1 PDZ domain-containing protein [Melissococcus plutonius S1]KMT25381.1 PDZ domain-containing protein [Melissococcus plutonius]KMT25650.1 PDZ domain-containing protein [Melissococcus plutonius]KMT26285.1 PDZ domain-containing protein [Melissococcus plutonius]KMT29027.1 PDZ domain-containing protein [Melissococcus plutonius]